MKTIMVMILMVILFSCSGTSVEPVATPFGEDSPTDDDDNDDTTDDDDDDTVMDDDDDDNDTTDDDDDDDTTDDDDDDDDDTVSDDDDDDTTTDDDDDTVIDDDDDDDDTSDDDDDTTEESCFSSTNASCEDLRGSCPEGQLCIILTEYNHPGYCVEWVNSNFYAPLDNPNSIEAPDGYGPMTRIDSEGTERWLKRCTNDLRECDYEYDGICCGHSTGFWISEGTTMEQDAHIKKICNADHELEIVVKNGHCYLESDEDENGDTFMFGLNNGDPNPLDPCLYCNSEINPFDWTLRPQGTSCGINAICTEDGECVVPELD